MSCINCFGDIPDLRKETKCTQCNSPIHKDCAIIEDSLSYCDTCYTSKDSAPKVVEWVLPEYIRRTYIETYRSCPHKFFLEVLKGHEAPPTCYTQIGIDLHELFDKAINDRSYPKEKMRDDMLVFWNAYQDTLFESDKQRNDMSQRITDSIEGFYAFLPSLPMPFATEETVFYSIGDDIPQVRFTMDYISENDNGNLDIGDWKTGGVMVGKKISSDLQAPLYIYGVQKHYNRIVDEFTFYYVKDGKTRVFRRTTDDNYVCVVGKREYHINLTDAIREVQALFNQIKKGNFNIPRETKKMYFTCKMCHLQAQGLCRGADEESWYQK